MTLEHSGWSTNQGFFCDRYFVDETKTDYEIWWKNKTTSKQLSPFENLTADFNNDGDVYTEFGAWFEGKYGGRDWYTPQNLLQLILDGEAGIKGITRAKEG